MPSRTHKTAGYDLVSDILPLRRAVKERVEAEGLSRYLINDGEITILPRTGIAFDAADVSLRFRPNLGIEYELTAIVTEPELAWPIDTGAKRAAIAELFVAHMALVVGRAADAARSAKAIRRAAEKVFDEARAEGIELEVTRIQAAPIFVQGDPERRGRNRQVFYVHVLMPHDDDGTLTEDSWTIDADDADDFAFYLRERTLPELRDLVARFPAPASHAADDEAR